MGIINLYKNFITYCPNELKEALLLFTDETNYPIHVHCTQGKDRTGLVIFFILSICGVPEDLIINDYAKTKDGLSIVYDAMLEDLHRNGLDSSFMDASPKNIIQLIEYIKHHYGSVESYLIDIGIDLALQNKIRNILCVTEL
ncbi:protein-tyrosine phosphatase-like protein [Cunninghamella echinulata]|nr:protein-tyrosine phosphatase-like protein [Cunninghamella echinulata]